MSTTDHTPTPTAEEVAEALATMRTPEAQALLDVMSRNPTESEFPAVVTLVRAALAAAPAEDYPDAEGLAVLAENEGRSVSPDDAHTETVTEYRVMAGEHRIGTSADLPTARHIAAAPQFADRSDVRVEARTVTTSRRESEWKATDQ